MRPATKAKGNSKKRGRRRRPRSRPEQQIIWLAAEIFVRRALAPRAYGAPPPELELAVEALDAARCFYEAVESYSFTQNKETP